MPNVHHCLLLSVFTFQKALLTAKYWNRFTYSFLGIAKTVQVLIEKGAYVNAVDNDNFSALLQAAWRGNKISSWNSSGRVYWFDDSCCWFSRKINSLYSLHMIKISIDFWNYQYQLNGTGHEYIVGILIDSGADLNVVTKSNENNALMAALIEGKHCFLQRFLTTVENSHEGNHFDLS